MSDPLVSVVITTKNEERNIENCIKSVLNQTYSQKNIEIIVVDNNSTDKTKEIANKYTKLIFNKGPERSAQRNFGLIEKSKGEHLLYLDADMTLGTKLIENCVLELADNKSIVALHISEIVCGEKYFSKVRRFERSFYDGTVIDGARFFRKEILQKVGGFDESMSGPEDWDLDKKLKLIGEIKLLPTNGIDSVIFHNEAEFSLKKYIFKKAYYARSFESYIKKWGKDDYDIKKQFGFYYRYFGVFVENGKWKKLILNPHLALGMYFLRFLVGFCFVIRGFDND